MLKSVNYANSQTQLYVSYDKLILYNTLHADSIGIIGIITCTADNMQIALLVPLSIQLPQEQVNAASCNKIIAT